MQLHSNGRHLSEAASWRPINFTQWQRLSERLIKQRESGANWDQGARSQLAVQPEWQFEMQKWERLGRRAVDFGATSSRAGEREPISPASQAGLLVMQPGRQPTTTTHNNNNDDDDRRRLRAEE